MAREEASVLIGQLWIENKRERVKELISTHFPEIKPVEDTFREVIVRGASPVLRDVGKRLLCKEYSCRDVKNGLIEIKGYSMVREWEKKRMKWALEEYFLHYDIEPEEIELKEKGYKLRIRILRKLEGKDLERVIQNIHEHFLREVGFSFNVTARKGETLYTEVLKEGVGIVGVCGAGIGLYAAPPFKDGEGYGHTHPRPSFFSENDLRTMMEDRERYHLLLIGDGKGFLYSPEAGTLPVHVRFE